MSVKVQDVVTMPKPKGGGEAKDVWTAYDKIENGGEK